MLVRGGVCFSLQATSRDNPASRSKYKNVFRVIISNLNTFSEFNFEVQHTSKVKDIQSFPLFLRHPESGKFMGITSIPPVNGLGGGGYIEVLGCGFLSESHNRITLLNNLQVTLSSDTDRRRETDQ
jgi:hypothetical protein